MLLFALADVPGPIAYENHKRCYRRGKRSKNAALKDQEFVTTADLHNFMRANPLPEVVEDMDETKMYAVDELANFYHRYPDTTGMALVNKAAVLHMCQVAALPWTWALHGDGKHKLHHGR